MVDRLASYRPNLNESSCQVHPTRCGTPWLGFAIYPEKRLLKARKARYATRVLREKYAAWRRGDISFAKLDASLQGWINHARHGDTWGLRRNVLRRLADR